MRIALSASAGATPIASSTWLRVTLPDEQAEPALTITPARSSAITCVDDATPGIAIESVFGRRGASAPNTAASGASAQSRCCAAIAQLGDIGVRFERCLRRPRRRAETDDAGKILGTRAQPPLLPAATQRRPQRETAAHRQRAAAHRSAELVRGERHQIDIERGEIDRDLACRLDRVAVIERVVTMRDARDLRNILHHARLVIGEHDRDQRRKRIGREHPIERIEIDAAIGQRRNGLRFRRVAAHRIMLDGGNQQTASGETGERQRIRLAAAAGEDDLVGARIDQQRDGIARLVEHAPRRRPARCTDDGLPVAFSAAATAAVASGRTGAVAFQSR